VEVALEPDAAEDRPTAVGGALAESSGREADRERARAAGRRAVERSA
jgi:hypothetical protein